MTKAPVAGQVKTRLTSHYSPQQAADIHRQFLLHMASRLSAMPWRLRILCIDPPDARIADLPDGFEYLSQSVGDLGARVASAATALRSRSDAILFIGTD